MTVPREAAHRRAGTLHHWPVPVALRYAAEQATFAPSIHNTQPWRFVLRGGRALEIHADLGRQLAVLDPRARQLTISLGCAVFNARVALGALGYVAVVERFPDPDAPTFAARITVPHGPQDWVELGVLDDAIQERRTNRRAFLEEPVTPQVVYELARAARAEGAVLLPITRRDQAETVARLSREADQVEAADPDYIAELAAWTTTDPHRPDGVQAASIPYAGEGAVNDDELPLRQFDLNGVGWLPASSRSNTDEQCLLLLGATGDELIDWLHAGEALEHVWLELTRHGYSASPVTQVIEVRRTNVQLRDELNLAMYPDVLLRVGHAADTESSRRRPLTEVITEVDGEAPAAGEGR